jgi:hypothetical protein
MIRIETAYNVRNQNSVNRYMNGATLAPGRLLLELKDLLTDPQCTMTALLSH